MVTSLNLVCGIIAIATLFENQPQQPYLPVIFIALAAVFDLLDGLLAKLLKGTSEFGKQLDSLADLVSFGVAPSFMIYKLLLMAFIAKSPDASFHIETISDGQKVVLYLSFLLAAFTALRLARFNITVFTSTNFIGLPVPASALTVVAVWLTFHSTDNTAVQNIILNPVSIYILIGVLCFLMVSNISMISLKFEKGGMRANLWRYLLILGVILLALIFSFTGLLIIMLYYFGLSFLMNIFSAKD